MQNLLAARLATTPLRNSVLQTTGTFNSDSDLAVRTFQRMNGLVADGIVGPNTWRALEGFSAGAPLPSVPSRASAEEPAWMAVARREIGTSEILGARHNPRILQYHASSRGHIASDEIAWCSSFINWCLAQVGLVGTQSAAAASWMHWGESCEPRLGAITVIHNPAAVNTSLSRSGNHVGFLVDSASTAFILLGGNQSDQVRESKFLKGAWRLKGHRWPRA